MNTFLRVLLISLSMLITLCVSGQSSRFYPKKTDYYTISIDGKNITVDGNAKPEANIILAAPTGNKNQQFRFIEKLNNGTSTNYFLIETKAKEGLYLTIDYSRLAEGTNIKLNPRKNNNQLWTFKDNAIETKLSLNKFIGTQNNNNLVIVNNGKSFTFKKISGNNNIPATVNQSSVAITSKFTAALTWSNGKTYFFKNADYIRFSSQNDLADSDYPKLIADGWRGIPNNFKNGIDAAFNAENGKTYYFKGNQYIRYDNNADKMDKGYPKLIADGWKGMPNSFNKGIDAAVLGKNNNVYFFKDNQYIRFNLNADKMDNGYPKLIADGWKGMPNNFNKGLDAACSKPGNLFFGGRTDIVYFFKGDDYVRFNLNADKMDNGYPLKIEEQWPGTLFDETRRKEELDEYEYEISMLCIDSKESDNDIEVYGDLELKFNIGNITLFFKKEENAINLNTGEVTLIKSGKFTIPKDYSLKIAGSLTDEDDAPNNDDPLGSINEVITSNNPSYSFKGSNGTEMEVILSLVKNGKFRTHNWMKDIKDNVNLKDLTIPGTHDAGADYGCPDYSYSKYGKCQDMTITQQLEAGVRYLDIRLKYNEDEDKLRIQHGMCYQDDDFGNVLKDIESFFKKNPTEAILMRIKDEDDNDTDKTTYEERFKKYLKEFSNIIYIRSDIPNLEQARGRIVIIDFCEKFELFHDYSELKKPKGSWHHKNDGDEYNRWLENWKQMISCSSIQSPREKLWLSAFNQNGLNWNDGSFGNIAESVNDVIGGLLTTTETPRDIAEYMTPKLEYDLNKEKFKKGTYGIVALDFPSKRLLKQLIDTNNMPSKIKK